MSILLAMLRDRDTVGLVVLVTFFSQLYFYIPVLTLWYSYHGLSLFQISTLSVLLFGALALAQVPTGVVADRFGRKSSLTASLVVQLIGEVVFLFADRYASFALTAVLAGFGYALASGAVEALVYDALLERGDALRMPAVMGSISAAVNLARIVAYFVGGLVVADQQPRSFVVTIALTVGCVAIAAVLSLAIRDRVVSPADRPEVRLADGIDALRRAGVLRRAVMLALTTQPLENTFSSLSQPYRRAAEVPAVLLGVVRSAGAALAVLGARSCGRLVDQVGLRRAAQLVAGLPGAVYLLLAATAHPVPAASLVGLQFGVFSMRGPVLMTLINRQLASRNRATVLSTIALLSDVYAAALGVLIARLADASLPLAFTLLGVVILAGLAASLKMTNDTPRRPKELCEIAGLKWCS